MSTEEFKVILVGDSGVGKTSFVIRFTEWKFQNVHEATLGVDCKRVLMEVRGRPIELHIWDTAGQERFRNIVNRFYRNANGAIVMYDVTRKSTFDNIPWWLQDLHKHGLDIPIILAGNKNDDSCNIEVLEELVQEFAEENHLYLYQTSARDNINVDVVFKSLAAMMLAERDAQNLQSDERSKLFAPTTDMEYESKIYLQPCEADAEATCCSFLYVKDRNDRVI